MAATQIIVTRLHEDWTELVAQNGGAAQTINTNIPYIGAADDPYVDFTMVLDVVVGVPAWTIAYAASATMTLNITITNTAAAGNSATWHARVQLQHTIIR